MPDLIIDMEVSLEAITNDSKMELCVFHRLDQPCSKIKVFNSVITSQNTMNVLGVNFESKLQWSAHVSNTSLRVNRAFYAKKNDQDFFYKR